MTTTHGGPRPGSGRKPNELPSHYVVIHATPEEHRRILDSMTPRERALALLGDGTEEPPAAKEAYDYPEHAWDCCCHIGYGLCDCGALMRD